MCFSLEQEIFALKMQKNLKKDSYLRSPSILTILEIKEIINRINYLQHQIQKNNIISQTP